MDKKEELMSAREGLVRWIVKSVESVLVLLMIAYFINRFFHIQILFDALIAVTLVLVIAFSHEVVHYYQAIKLGYKPKWWRTRFMMGIEISSHSNRKQWRKDNHKIAIAPYYFAFPVSFMLVIAGVYFSSLGILVAGVASLILHTFTYTLEGREYGGD